MKKTKNNKKLLSSIDTSKVYEPIEAIKVLKENSYTKFEESLEVAINLGIDSNKTDQNIRGVINLPKGTGKSINIAVLASGEKQEEAKKAGANIQVEPRWQPHVVVDRELVTGQNPQSDEVMVKAFIEMLDKS